MRLPQFSIALLGILVALVAADSAWYQFNYQNQSSAFGFSEAPAFDTGVLPIANVTTIAVYFMLTRNGRLRTWLTGFVVGALANIVAFLLLGCFWPDGVRLWLRPIYPVWDAWSTDTPPKSYLYIADTVCFLPVQLFIATLTGFLTLYVCKTPREIAPMRGERVGP